MTAVASCPLIKKYLAFTSDYLSIQTIQQATKRKVLPNILCFNKGKCNPESKQILLQSGKLFRNKWSVLSKRLHHVEQSPDFLKNYILLCMLLQLLQFFPLWLSLPSLPKLSQTIPTPVSMSMVMHICSLATLFPMLYFTSPWLFCNYQFALFNPFTFFTQPPPIWQPSKCSLYLWFCFSFTCSFILFQIQLLIDMYLLPFYWSHFWSS